MTVATTARLRGTGVTFLSPRSPSSASMPIDRVSNADPPSTRCSIGSGALVIAAIVITMMNAIRCPTIATGQIVARLPSRLASGIVE